MAKEDKKSRVNTDIPNRTAQSLVYAAVFMMAIILMSWVGYKTREERSTSKAQPAAAEHVAKPSSEKKKGRTTETIVSTEMVEVPVSEAVCRDITGYHLGDKTGTYKEMPMNMVITYYDNEKLVIKPDSKFHRLKHKRLKSICFENIGNALGRAKLQLAISS